METESSNLIIIKKRDSFSVLPKFSYKDDIEKLTNLLNFIIGFINILIITFLIFIVIFKQAFLLFSKFWINNQKDLKYYQDIQNNFCKNFRNFYDKVLEKKLILSRNSLNNTKFEIFIYDNNDFLSRKIKINNSYDNDGTLHMLNAIRFYTKKYNYSNNDIIIIDIGANIGWYTIFFGELKYNILSFEALPENNYILKKNYCRNIKNFSENESTTTIINTVLYQYETFCDYYKNVNNRKQNLVLCDKKKKKNLDNNYIKIDRIKSSKFTDFIPYINNKKITLLILNIKYEGEMAIKSEEILISKYKVPFIFIEFNLLIFSIQETNPQEFLSFFTKNGYKISLDGFLTDHFINIDDLMKMKFEDIALYLIYSEKRNFSLI